MTNLVIDIGNSSLKAAFAQGTRLSETYRYQEKDLYGFIRDLARSREVNTIAISSVRSLDGSFYNRLKKECENLIVVSGETRLPIKNLYSTPDTLGPDRISAATGAAALFPGKQCIIFDFGTALTIDFLGSSGEFMGGNISLGMKSRFRALNDYTQKIPLVGTPVETGMIGTNTVSAVESGIILGLIFEAEGYICRFPDYIYIFTGGDAIYFAEKMKSPIFVVYNLVLIGLAHIAEYNAKS